MATCEYKLIVQETLWLLLNWDGFRKLFWECSNVLLPQRLFKSNPNRKSYFPLKLGGM